MNGYVLAIDQGTTSSRAIIFDKDRKVVGKSQQEFTQIYPQSGWVEHDPEEIWQSVLSTCAVAIENAKIQAGDVAAIGITNQRETVIVWDKITGKPIHNAIVWQDRRTAPFCQKLKKQGLEKKFTRKTGLLLDPYFSGTKLSWILDKVPGARKRAANGELLFGTIDSFLIWRLTAGKMHATDATNASRTLLFNIATNEWDDELLEILRVPRAMLPEVKDCAANYGAAEADLFGAAIPILGVAGDQHAATIGQACFEPGMFKSTYGTGCFALLNTGSDMVLSKNRLLTTIAYRLNGKTTYALEGSIFIAGAAVQWLRDGLKLIGSAPETGKLADQADPSQNVYLVPAFVGLGAPHWDAEARGAIYGLTRNSGPAEFARAALESVAYQTRDLLDAMRKDWKSSDTKTVLRVDGGMVASDWTMQRLADILDAPVDRPVILETTALGAAWLAGSKAGIWPNRREFAKTWERDTRFTPKMDEKTRKTKIAGWKSAVKRTLTS
ncbi:glycerol kinase GlpK [Phyllobacterium zundukense]|uniref:Glycerol kinase n=1 Tax=Phyllobacterium zundukense TaxID=1867719 RepID=A0A2N9VU03_9HYPH|nr:glycerol kinase GlpK [Phyllobacterium zundukense]ATU93085.1 glycerol kinase [Phyllobacterium zundukense]PIO42971.1 glycerol kinase [Phyllobacterium zundukense]